MARQHERTGRHGRPDEATAQAKRLGLDDPEGQGRRPDTIRPIPKSLASLTVAEVEATSALQSAQDFRRRESAPQTSQRRMP